MATFKYNDMEFAVTAAGAAWDILRVLPGGATAVVGTGLFAGAAEADAQAKGLALVKAIYPVGIKVVGPDVAHPNMIGDLKIVGPDVTHPNFIHWDQDSASFPAQL
jgi:hypothetical protein